MKRVKPSCNVGPLLPKSFEQASQWLGGRRDRSIGFEHRLVRVTDWTGKLLSVQLKRKGVRLPEAAWLPPAVLEHKPVRRLAHAAKA